MGGLRYLTAGESHGRQLTAIIDGFPSGLRIDIPEINAELKRRQQGVGRGGRMKIESDSVCFTAGVRNSVTTGNPISFYIENKDYAAWKDFMDCGACDTEGKKLTKVRPGHADLTGCRKYNHTDARNVLERASARETAARVAAGAICRQLLKLLGIEINSAVNSIGGVKFEGADGGKAVAAAIEKARADGDTLGGKISLFASGVRAGFGSHTQYDKKAEYIITACLMSIQGVKSVSVGLGEGFAGTRGSAAHDEIFARKDGKDVQYYRKTNNAGGVEGGMTNGEPLIFHLAMKPIPTLMKGLKTVDIATGETAAAAAERSDVCAAESCAVVAESALAFALLSLVLERTGGDYVAEIVERYNKYK
jgi:chorismate synthase